MNVVGFHVVEAGAWSAQPHNPISLTVTRCRNARRPEAANVVVGFNRVLLTVSVTLFYAWALCTDGFTADSHRKDP
jgi:hypothetical protein